MSITAQCQLHIYNLPKVSMLVFTSTSWDFIVEISDSFVLISLMSFSFLWRHSDTSLNSLNFSFSSESFASSFSVAEASSMILDFNSCSTEESLISEVEGKDTWKNYSSKKWVNLAVSILIIYFSNQVCQSKPATGAIQLLPWETRWLWLKNYIDTALVYSRAQLWWDFCNLKKNIASEYHMGHIKLCLRKKKGISKYFISLIKYLKT